MPVTATAILTAADGVNRNAYTTASVSLSANKLVLLAVLSGSGTNPTAIPTVTGASRTWTQFGTAIEFNGLRRFTIFRSLSGSANSGALTIDFAGAEQTRCGWSINEFGNVDTTGTNGANAVVQSVTAAGTGTTSFTINLAAFSSTDNATYGGMMMVEINATITAGTGFTELGQAHTGESGSIQTQWRNDNDTSVNWTFADGANDLQAGTALEIKYVAADVSGTPLRTLMGVGV